MLQRERECGRIQAKDVFSLIEGIDQNPRALQHISKGKVALVESEQNLKQKQKKRDSIPEYLEMGEIQSLIKCAPHPRAALLMLEQWRAGLRVSEALMVEVGDITLDGEYPTIKIRRGKGNRERLVPLHPELSSALKSVLSFSGIKSGRLIGADRTTAWRWVKEALRRAEELGAIPKGRRVGTHTLRHSAARHWLKSRVPLNVVSLWLGHKDIKTTLIYLRILPDPTGHMNEVP